MHPSRGQSLCLTFKAIFRQAFSFLVELKERFLFTTTANEKAKLRNSNHVNNTSKSHLPSLKIVLSSSFSLSVCEPDEEESIVRKLTQRTF